MCSASPASIKNARDEHRRDADPDVIECRHGFMIFRTRYALAALAFVTACGAAATQPAPPNRPGQVEPCNIAGLGPARCATVPVRESANSNRMVDLRVVVLPAQTNSPLPDPMLPLAGDRKSTRLNSSHSQISYAVFCLKKKKHTLADRN